MANALYAKGRESFLKGEISWSADNIKTVLVDTATYSVDLANHQFLSDIPAGERVATSANLTNKTTVAGVADADDVTYTAVSGDQSEALVIYQDTGTPSTSRLIAYIDSATGLPVTPNGGDIQVQWDNGASKIFKL
jgi:phage tail sheath gpL-like